MRWRIALFVLLTLAILSAAPARAHLRAALVLRRFAEGSAITAGSGFRSHIEESDEELPGRSRARLYLPRDRPEPPGLVLVHGIHRLGIDEPRVVRFARSLAENGVAVLTPDVRELADYRLDPRSIETIGAAAHTLRTKLSRKIGVMGTSFAGGLALLAASDPRFETDIGLVLAIGAHHDAARVCRFFATNRIERVDGQTTWLSAHPYGVLVFVYAHADRFFPEDDVPRARESLALWLAERREDARTHAAGLGSSSRALLDAILDHRMAGVAPQILEKIGSAEPSLRTVSPRHRLASLHLPVFLLHGTGDTVIPPTETEWLAHDVPARELRDVLISPAVVHIEMGGKPTFFDQVSLVHFLAEVLTELDALPFTLPAGNCADTLDGRSCLTFPVPCEPFCR